MNYKNGLKYLSIALYLVYVAVWVYIQFYVPEGAALRDHFTDTYGIIAGIGAVAGLLIAKEWGGLKSILGRSLTFFSIGLLFQFLGQVCYAIYFYVYNIENPYPSFGEVFYFGSILIYIYAVWQLAKVSGSGISLKQVKYKILAIGMPIMMMVISYIAFLRNYEIDPESPLVTFLDFGYPLGQAIYVALALVAYFLSRNLLGGIMKNKVRLILIALCVQYVADSLFLYKTFNDLWNAAGMSDFVFMTAYIVMAVALCAFDLKFLPDHVVKLLKITENPIKLSGVESKEVYEQLIGDLLKDQEKIVGSEVVQKTNDIPGLTVNPDLSVRIDGDPEIVMQNLTNFYKSLFGDVSVEVMIGSIKNFAKKSSAQIQIVN